MSRPSWEARFDGPPTPPKQDGPPAPPKQDGALSLEAVMVLPVLALLIVGLLQVAALVTDVLVLHDAARAGARTAATTTGVAPVVEAAREAAPELEGMQVIVSPSTRGDGDLAQVQVSVVRTIGPVSHTLEATAYARVEPAVGTTRSGP